MKNLVTIALLGTAIVSGAAYAQTAQPADRAAPAATASPAASSDKMMLKGKWRASKLMGVDVYNEANEKLGDINELILDKDGKVNAVVIGVGGFLGMGQKNVAVPFDKISATQNPQDGTIKLTTTETAESLKAAPEFKTLAMQASDKAAGSAGTSTMPATDNTTTSSTTNK